MCVGAVLRIGMVRNVGIGEAKASRFCFTCAERVGLARAPSFLEISPVVPSKSWLIVDFDIRSGQLKKKLKMLLSWISP